MHTPTPEQATIIRAVAESAESLMISAYAGTAKTTTLEMIANSLTSGSNLALAFNVKIKNELAKRFPANFTVLTLNGLGHRAWSTAIGKRLTVDENKLSKLVTQAIKQADLSASRETWTTLRQLISAAMQAGLVPQGTPGRGLIPDTNDSWEAVADAKWLEVNQTMIDLARVVLKESIHQGYQGIISFDDQIYLSALFGGVFPRYPLVMVDEAQDLSPLNHIQIGRSAASRIIAVGDPRQAIYAFRGADHESMTALRGLRLAWLDLPLTLTFRCPKIVVGRQQNHAPGFTAHLQNALGQFLPWREGWTWPQVSALGTDIFVLCRNNAPLLSLAFKLLRKGIGCRMLGRDIGKNLILLSQKILPLDDTPQIECIRQVTQWQENQIALTQANNKPEREAGITDRAESLLAVLESTKTAGALREALESLFARDSGQVVLSTGHRAKGLEADVVVHLDPWRIPSKWAHKDEQQLIQEKNLLYVIETRARKILVEADLKTFS